ncbi:MAG: M55 family metallopeptidase, partial [Anaerolineae bacterium]
MGVARGLRGERVDKLQTEVYSAFVAEPIFAGAIGKKRFNRRCAVKVFISADIEGVTGATNWNETDKAHADY